MRTNKHAQSGNEIVLSIDGNVLGVIQSIRINEDYAPEPCKGIGSIEVLEYVPTLARNQIQVSRMVLRNDTLRKSGVLVTNAQDMLLGNVFDILVIDKPAKTVLRKASGCSYASGDTEVRANAIVVSNCTFNVLSLDGEQL